jgi:hypothetical protein
MSASELNTTRKIGPASAGLLMTPDEFDAITDYDDRYRYELIRGVLVVNPIPSEAEGDPNRQSHEELGHDLDFVYSTVYYIGYWHTGDRDGNSRSPLHKGDFVWAITDSGHSFAAHDSGSGSQDLWKR